MTVEDRMTLPDGRTPPILAVNGVPSPDGQFDADMLELMPHEVTVQPFTARDAYGAQAFGTATVFRALVTDQQKLVRQADGQQVVCAGIVYVTDQTAANYITAVAFG